MQDDITLSVVTLTLNAAAQLPTLIESLKEQTDAEFRWVVVDGGSTDGTLALLQGDHGLDITYISEPDFSLWHAFNKAVGLLETEYYLPAGADDRLYPDAVALYKRAASSRPDMVAAAFDYGPYRSLPGTTYRPSRGIWSLLTSHSIGTLIRKDLHDRHGLYSNRYVLAADMALLQKAYNNGARIVRTEEPAGWFNRSGISGRYYLRNLFESTLIRLENGNSIYAELPQLAWQIIRHYRRLKSPDGRF